MGLAEMLLYRRSVRKYDETKPLDDEKVRACLELASLAPNSSNMQLWEFYHVTDKAVLKDLAHACLDQSAARTATEMVVFVTRQDLYSKHAKEVLKLSCENVLRTSPPDRQPHRIKRFELYYKKVMPFLYARFFGLLGLLRKILVQVLTIFRPITLQVTEADTRVVVHKSCALAAQTFMIAMAEAGYDTCPLEGFDSRRVKNRLRLPYRAEINMIVCCGIRKEGGVQGDRVRLPFDEIYRRV